MITMVLHTLSLEYNDIPVGYIYMLHTSKQNETDFVNCFFEMEFVVVKMNDFCHN